MSNSGQVPGNAAAGATGPSLRWARRVELLMQGFPWICAGLSVAIGAFTLLGWLLGYRDWTTVFPGLPSMEANSAVMALLGGVSLVLLAPANASRPRVVVGRIVAAAMLGLAIMPLLEHLLGVDFAIDRALANQGESLFHSSPGRASPQTAAAFALVGIALLSLDARTRRGHRPSPAVALLAALIPLISLLAYVFGTAELYGVHALYPYIGMGILTAAAVLALCAGTLAARAADGPLSVLMRRDSGGLAARQLVTWLLILAVATSGIEAGARFDWYAAPIGAAGIMLLGMLGGAVFILRVSHQLSRLDTEQRRRERDAALLSQVGGILTSSLDYEATLPMVAQLAVRGFADFCVVDLAEGKRSRRLAAMSRDAADAAVCDALMDTPVDGPVTVSDRLRDAFGTMPWVIDVPLRAHARLVGDITFARSPASTAYDDQDTRVAEDLAQRAALAIENGQLYGAAQQAIRARDDLMGIVAHDLRNPLSVVLMQAEVLREVHPNGDGQMDQAASAIVNSATRMNRLIQDLLDVSRIEAGGLSLQREPIDPATLLADAVASQRPLASSQQLDLRLDIQPALPTVEGDRDRLMQVLENLIGNAIKFSQAGGRITLGARTQDRSVRFWVSDGGAGIRQEDLPRVFDRFYQAKEQRRTAHGTGLGLPIVKGIVEAHGGRVWIESTAGKGTTVSFTIPVARAAVTS